MARAFGFQSEDLAAKGGFIRDAMRQGIALENADFDLGQYSGQLPWMAGVMKLEALQGALAQVIVSALPSSEGDASDFKS